MRKLIKKILNFIGWTLLSFMILSVVISIVINIPVVQDRITSAAFEKLEGLLGNKLTYSGVHLRLLNKAEFDEILISDTQNDTLLYSPKLKLSFPGILRRVLVNSKTPMRMGVIDMEGGYIRLYIDSLNNINVKFISDSIRTHKDPDKISEPFYIDRISIKNSRLDIHKADSSGKDFGINFSKMTFTDFNAEVKDLRAYMDTVEMSVKQLELLEQSGFHLQEFESKLLIDNSQMHFNNTVIKTAQSKMSFDKVHFDFNSFSDFADGGILNKVRLGIDCENADLNLIELRYFSKVFEGMDNEMSLSGKFYGPISNFNARELNIEFGEQSILKGKFDIIGLPNTQSAFLIFDINELNTIADDIAKFKLGDNKYINLPDLFRGVSYYNYKGNFTGFFNDFVSYGSLETNIGDSKIDLLFRPDSNNTVGFIGSLSTEKLDVGELTNMPEEIGDIKFTMEVDGRGTIDKGFKVDLTGDIQEFQVKGYNYKNMVVDGNFSENRFNGNIKIDDENLRMNFEGLLDFSSAIKRYNFTANVFHANLFNLNIHQTDTNYTASFLINANVSGNKLDDINGEVSLLNSLFSKTNAQIQVYDLSLKIRNDSIKNELALYSDFMDAEIAGHYRLSQVFKEYIYLIDNYFPSLGLYQSEQELLAQSDFKYSVKFKNSMPLFEYFTPNYSVKPHTIVNGELKRGDTESANLHIESPGIKLKKSHFNNLVLNSATSDTAIEMELGCSEFNLNNRITLDNFTMYSLANYNDADFTCRWLNWDSTLNRGSVSGQIAFFNAPGRQLNYKGEIDSSTIVLNDSLWVLHPFNFIVDSNNISINSFKLSHNKEYFAVGGRLMDESTDSLYCVFNNFNFANLNLFTRSSTFKFGGILDGDAIIKGYRKPLFFTSLFIDKLELNGELIGDTYIESKWNNRRQAIELDLDVFRGELNTISGGGDYFPTKKGKLNLALNLEGFKLNFINPYLNTVFSDIQGLASGLLSITGTVRKPNLNGDLNIQNAGLTVDYLQTRYRFNANVGIANNNFVFDEVELNDKYKNTATLSGIIRTEYLKNFSLNISLQPRNFLCLNTTQSDNESYFGTAFATGLVRINGPTSELKFDITANTEPGTEFNIPLSKSESISEYNFIQLIDFDTLAVVDEKEEYKVNLTGMQLDFDLNVTPDAQMNIIFDQAMGDIITARGNGDLRIAINPLGDFKMLGEYIIESGTYLFTLKDVLVNKKFKVKQGSYLQWSGEPMDANINIDTYYRTKASLSDLTGDVTSTYRYSIDCQLGLTGKLKEPEVNYNIYLPFAEQEQRDRVSAEITSNEKMAKQFLSLLVLNRFMPSTGQDQSTRLETSNIAGVNASELLSNQLSNWLSQISDEFDIGVNYRPGSEFSERELELALSTQLLNDRLSINGSVDMKTNAEAQEAKNQYLGNLDVDYKLSKKGKVRARAYNRANDNEVANYSKYTQGLGVFYTEEFDKFSDIGKKKGLPRKSSKQKRKLEKAVLRKEDSSDKE